MPPEPCWPSRRALLAGGLGLAPFAWASAAAPAANPFAQLERSFGGRLGVTVLDTGSGRRLAHRGDERFPMCSTFKWLLAAAVLHRVDRGLERLDRRIGYTKADLLLNSPTTEAHVGAGALPVDALCEAAVTLSDNAAANLLLSTLGGPAGLTRWLREAGDPVTRLDHKETELNDPPPGDPSDTTTPAAMVRNLSGIALAGPLKPASRERLVGWLVANKTGATRLRAGLPAGWRVGDKTGAWNGKTTNDVAIAWPPSRQPILIAAYCTGGSISDEGRNAVLAEVGRIAARTFGAGAHD